MTTKFISIFSCQQSDDPNTDKVFFIAVPFQATADEINGALLRIIQKDGDRYGVRELSLDSLMACKLPTGKSLSDGRWLIQKYIANTPAPSGPEINDCTPVAFKSVFFDQGDLPCNQWFGVTYEQNETLLKPLRNEASFDGFKDLLKHRVNTNSFYLPLRLVQPIFDGNVVFMLGNDEETHRPSLVLTHYTDDIMMSIADFKKLSVYFDVYISELKRANAQKPSTDDEYHTYLKSLMVDNFAI